MNFPVSHPVPHSEWLLSEEEWCVQRLGQWLPILKAGIYGECVQLCAECRPAFPMDTPSTGASASFRSVRPMEKWGVRGEYTEFRFFGEIPKHWKGRRVEALIDLEGEAGILDENGDVVQRLSSGNAFGVPCQLDAVAVSPCCEGGEAVDIRAHAWASSIVGLHRPLDPDPGDAERNGSHDAHLRRAELRVASLETRGLFHDAEVLLGVALQSPPHSTRRAKVLGAMMNALFAWQDDPCRSAIAREILRPELERPAVSSSLEAVAIGHAHIDTAWLWRVQDSVGKCLRTFASQADLIEKNAGYRFGASSAQHYAFVKRQQPALHRKIQRLVAEGRWEIQGGMWVEPDTNIPSGESLVRQILYGQQFFRAEFGRECDVAWLPDVFGLSAALPQILSKSGLHYLLTKKPHWSRVNHFPRTAFRWVGHDGSEILVHILPQARDYNGLMRVEDILAAERGFAEKTSFDRFLYTFGIGDGGGGPTEEMLERAVRMRSLEGVPRVRFGSSQEVFADLDARRNNLEAVDGDLYLEAHRGTLTTQARLKKENRRLEFLLRRTEHLLCYLAPSMYPREELRRIWQSVLLNQFHDILPGSSINEVVADAQAANAESFEKLTALEAQFAQTLPVSKEKISYFNCLGIAWSGVVPAIGGLVPSGAAEASPSQREPDGQTVSRVTIAPNGFSVFSPADAAPEATPMAEPILENEFLCCRFDPNGALVSVTDKTTGSEVLAPGAQGNRLALYVDRPIDFDAWDIDHFYPQELVATAQATAPWTGWTGPARSVLIFSLAIGNSEITQRCILTPGSRRLDFETTVQWRERHRMLRVGFTPNLERPTSRCEIQHGYLERSTHQNTPYEKARFEVPCHRYACLLDRNRGAALLNDSKYGVRLQGNLIELALLRSPTYPDHSADLGEHRFTYSFLPLASAVEFEKVIEEAALLNARPAVFERKDASALSPLFSAQGRGISLEAVKRSEDSDDLIIRIAEVLGGNTALNIGGSIGKRNAQIYSATLLEKRGERINQGKVQSLKPFELCTFLLRSAEVLQPKPNETVVKVELPLVSA